MSQYVMLMLEKNVYWVATRILNREKQRKSTSSENGNSSRGKQDKWKHFSNKIAKRTKRKVVLCVFVFFTCVLF